MSVNSSIGERQVLSQLRNLLLQIFRIMLIANFTDNRSRSEEDTFGTLGIKKRSMQRNKLSIIRCSYQINQLIKVLVTMVEVLNRSRMSPSLCCVGFSSTRVSLSLGISFLLTLATFRSCSDASFALPFTKSHRLDSGIYLKMRKIQSKHPQVTGYPCGLL